MTSYDENLLASAPRATKAQLQDGYNPDILVEKKSSTPTSPAVDPEAVNRIPTPPHRKDDIAPLTKKKAPFYATKKGIITIVVLVVVVIIAAVVGGVVGTRKSKSPNDVSNGTGVGQENGPQSASATSSGQFFGSNGAGAAPTPTGGSSQGISSSNSTS